MLRHTAAVVTHLVAAALALSIGGMARAAEPARKPNILIILADDMGFSDAGCYGGEIATPNLDALAKNGLRFTQFYNTARCWPSRAAILTGYYAQQVRRDTFPGIKSGSSGIRPGWAKLLPEMLHPLGYRSYHSGKWHVDGKPLQNGFDHSYSLEDHDRHFTPRQHTEDDKPLPPVDAKTGYYSSTAIADHAIKCLKEHAEKYHAQPFFEYLAFTAPHFPLQAPAEDVARYRKTYLAGWDAMRQDRWKRLQDLHIGGTSLSAIERDLGPPYSFPADLKKLGPNELNRPLPWKDLTAEQRDFQAGKMAVHAAMVDRMDREIGRVLAQVRAMGAWDDTLIFFLSDNGASAEIMVRGDGHDPHAECGTGASFVCIGPGWSSLANTPFRRHKTWVHEGGISTPLIVHWPKGIVARGEMRHTPGHIIDIVPTILEAVGGKRLEQWNGKPVPPAPGKSLVPLFAKDGTVHHDSFWWLHEGNRALRVGNWKIVAAGKESPWELYDLTMDRSESKNLAADRPEKVRELAAMWTKQSEEYAALAAKDLPPDEKPKREATWKAGVAKAVITPEKGVWLAGYGSKRPPDGKLHDLWMKALALEDHQGRRVVLVTSDFQGIPKEMSDRVFEQLRKKLKLEREQVMITFSHNHCGPRLSSDLVDYYPVEEEQVKLVDEYTALMETKLVEMVGKALADLAPARLQVGEGRATFAVNRRNNREADVPAILARGEALKGPVDHTVPVMTVARSNGTVVAILFGYACHPTTLSFTKWCGDYPGFAQIALEKKHPGATAMFVNTCGGDQNPLPRRTVELCEKYGQMLADGVEEALKKPMKEIPPGLQTAFTYVDLPYEKVMTRDDLLAFTKDQNVIRKRWAARMLKKLDAGEKFAAKYPYPLHAWRLGQQMLILGMGAETVVDYALRFKTEFGRGTWVCGYADDMISYIPSRRVWAEGGYEGGPNLYEYGRPALRWNGDIEDRISEAMKKLVKSVEK